MQFKEVGKKIQVLAYEGYDKEKRRSVIRMKGSIDRYTYELTDGLLESLTDEQKKELQEYIDNKRQKDEKRSMRASALYADSSIERVTDAIKAAEDGGYLGELDVEWARRTWAALDALGKELKRLGYPKSRTLPKAPEKPQETAKPAKDTSSGDLFKDA